MKSPRIRSVEIPDEEQGVFASLARLADPALEGLERALRDAIPTLDKQKLVSQLRRETLLAEVQDLEDIVGSLVSVAGTAYSGQVNIDEFADQVVDAIRNDRVIEITKAEANVLAERLKRLSKIPCIEIVAKGNSLLRANNQNFQSAQIVTDLRPVCLGDELNVSAGIILHQLAIRAFHNGEAETVYFTLDSEDLSSLSEVVARALRKERSLRQFADSTATPILIPFAGM
jgi:hypothetical protein